MVREGVRRDITEQARSGGIGGGRSVARGRVRYGRSGTGWAREGGGEHIERGEELERRGLLGSIWPVSRSHAGGAFLCRVLEVCFC